MAEGRLASSSAGIRVALGLALALLAAASGAVVFEPREFADEGQRRAYLNLVAELRCLVCQNQNLAESNAELAQDLRAEVYRMLREGNSEGDVIEFMVARYGDFVLYRPPMRPATLLLWFGPFVLAFGSVAGLLLHLRARARRSQALVAPLAATERETLARVIDDVRPQADGTDPRR